MDTLGRRGKLARNLILESAREGGRNRISELLDPIHFQESWKQLVIVPIEDTICHSPLIPSMNFRYNLQRGP